MIYSILPFASATLILSLGFIVFFANKQSKENRSLFYMCVGLSCWLYCYFINYLFPHSPRLNLFLGKFGYTGVTIIPLMYHRFIDYHLNLKRNILRKLITIVSIVFIGLAVFTNLIVKGMFDYFWGPYPIAGKLHPFYLVFVLGVFVYCLFQMFIYGYIINDPKVNRNKVRYLFWAFLLANIGSIDFIQNYGFEFYPLGAINIDIYVIIMTYAILKHKLLDINIVIKKGLIYSLLITTISSVYIISALIVESSLRKSIGYTSLPFTVIITSLIVVIFNPLKNRIQKFIDNRFFRGSIDQIDEENTKLRDELQKSEKMKAVATLAAGMAHEIKNPLTSIKTFTEYIDKKQNDPDFINKFKEVVGPEVDRINHIVKQLLEFSKPSELELKDTNINELLTETLELLNNNLITRNIKVEKHLNDIPTIKVDPNQLKQVFLNLFLNAIDAINTNGTITVSTGHGDRATGHVSISIKDTGCGITHRDIPRLFDPFFTSKDSGTGLGLSVVHGIIEKHNGKIEVKSEIDEGTEFVIEL